MQNAVPKGGWYVDCFWFKVEIIEKLLSENKIILLYKLQMIILGPDCFKWKN